MKDSNLYKQSFCLNQSRYYLLRRDRRRHIDFNGARSGCVPVPDSTVGIPNAYTRSTVALSCCICSVLVFSDKQALPDAMSAAEETDKMGHSALHGHKWQ